MKFNDPTPKYTTQPNGDVTIEWLPPTALMMTAHREMEKFTEIISGQGRTMQTMQEHINYLTNQVTYLEGIINELKAPQPTDRVGEHSSSADSIDPSAEQPSFS